MRHELKTWEYYFRALELGLKTFEIRKNDRNYKVGDVLVLQEFDPDSMEYSGREIEKTVTYIARGVFGLPEDVCVMALTAERDKYRDACERLVGHYGDVRGHWICQINSCTDHNCDDPDVLYIGHDDYVNGYDFARQVKAELEGIEGSEIEVGVE